MKNYEIKKAIEECKKIKKCGLYAIMYCDTRNGKIWTNEYTNYWSYTHYEDSAVINVTAYMWEWELPLTVKGVRKCIAEYWRQNSCPVEYIHLGAGYERKDGTSSASLGLEQWFKSHPNAVKTHEDFRSFRARKRYVFTYYPYDLENRPLQKAVYAKAYED